MKAGCAYVPLDPDSPADRTDFIARDADVKLVLTSRHLMDRLSQGAYRIICVDEESASISSQCSEPCPRVHRPDDAAYIIYTSGSTGAPKGVVVEHRSLVNYLTWVDRVLFKTAPRLIPATTKCTFDASLKQLFAPLLTGHPVWLISEETTSSPVRLLSELRTRGAFTLNCVPWLWRVLLDDLEKEGSVAALPLAGLFLGGEEISDDMLDRTFRRFPDLEIWNLYGPTEATANATAQRLAFGDPISIGRPIANTHALVLDGCGRLLPAGVPGELHIGGAALARGYWNRPQLTTERFVSGRGYPLGERLYKTGDWVRHRDDGSLECLGRLDRQIKLRGFRVELGEIETVLRRHPAIQDCAVALVTSSGQPSLVAFVELSPHHPATSANLRAFVFPMLPAYMIPSRFVVLDRLPRNKHGKIDLSALPTLVPEQTNATDSLVAPGDEDEQRIVDIWAAVLGNHRIGLHSNFFELGGHSLLAVQAVSRVRDVFSVEISLRAFFNEPTPQGVARLVREARRCISPTRVERIPRLDRSTRRI